MVFRIWSDRVPDRLAAGPSPEELEAPSTRRRSPRPTCRTRSVGRSTPKRRGRPACCSPSATATWPSVARWRTADPPRRARRRLDVDPEQGADALEALLAGHAASGDLAFVTPGTPTNNTGSTWSGFRRRPPSRSPHGRRRSRGRRRHRARRQRRASRRRAGSARRPRGGARGRRPPPRARLGPRRRGRRPAGTTRPSCSTPRQRRDHRRHAGACCGGAPRAGPLPAIRVGPQPYGVLPVASRRLSPHLDSAVDLNLHRYSGMLRSMWDEQVHRVPRLGRAGETRRRRRDARAAPAHPGAVGAALAGDRPTAAVDGDRMAGHVPRPAGVLALRRHRPAGHPAGPAGPVPVPHRDRRQPSARRATRRQGRRRHLLRGRDRGARSPGRRRTPELNLRQNSIALLEALLAFAAVQELDKAASAELVEGLTEEDRAAAGFARKGVRTRSRAGGGARPAAAPDAVRASTDARRADRSRFPGRGA